MQVKQSNYKQKMPSKNINFKAIIKCNTFESAERKIKARLLTKELSSYEQKFERLVSEHQNKPYDIKLGCNAYGAVAEISIKVTDDFKKAFSNLKKMPVAQKICSIFKPAGFTPEILRKEGDRIFISTTSDTYSSKNWIGMLENSDNLISKLLN